MKLFQRGEQIRKGIVAQREEEKRRRAQLNKSLGVESEVFDALDGAIQELQSAGEIENMLNDMISTLEDDDAVEKQVKDKSYDAESMNTDRPCYLRLYWSLNQLLPETRRRKMFPESSVSDGFMYMSELQFRQLMSKRAGRGPGKVIHKDFAKVEDENEGDLFKRLFWPRKVKDRRFPTDIIFTDGVSVHLMFVDKTQKKKPSRSRNVVSLSTLSVADVSTGMSIERNTGLEVTDLRTLPLLTEKDDAEILGVDFGLTFPVAAVARTLNGKQSNR